MTDGSDFAWVTDTYQDISDLSCLSLTQLWTMCPAAPGFSPERAGVTPVIALNPHGKAPAAPSLPSVVNLIMPRGGLPVAVSALGCAERVIRLNRRCQADCRGHSCHRCRLCSARCSLVAALKSLLGTKLLISTDWPACGARPWLPWRHSVCLRSSPASQFWHDRL